MDGTFTDKIHELDVRVYYEDTDFSGVVYHANYLKFAERGRSSFLRLAGVIHSDLLTHEPPLAFVVRGMNIEFVAPARIDDVLVVETIFTTARGPRLTAWQTIRRNGELLWQAEIQAACIDLDGKPRRMPATTVDQMAPWLKDKPPDFNAPQRG